MTQERMTRRGWVVHPRDVVWFLAIIAAAILFVVMLNAVFGVHGLGPTYEIVPDPAGLLPF